MIVKNGGEDLRACLGSVRSIVEQIVIADTGSTDNTVDIAREFGAIVVDFPWTDHYAEARNAALEPLRTDWVLVLDADEELGPEGLTGVPDLIHATGESVGGYRLTIRNYFPVSVASMLGALSRANDDGFERAKAARSYSDYCLCRLFRRHPKINFAGRVHEGIEAQARQAGYVCRDSAIRVLHFGNLMSEGNYKKKQEYYRNLLRRAVAESPRHPHLWIQLALEEIKYFDNSEYAIECAEKALAINPQEYEAWAIISGVHRDANRYAQALKALERLPDSGDWVITKASGLGDLLHNLGRYKEARAMYLQALERTRRSNRPLPAEYLASLESRVGYTEVQLGLYKVGFRKLHRAIEASPAEADNHDRLTKACILRQDDRGAADAAESTLRYLSDEKAYRRAVALRVRLHESDRARLLLDAGLQAFPQSVALQRMSIELEPREG
jgi:glycosyltransferase involved in cell wall biosynthesis